MHTKIGRSAARATLKIQSAKRTIHLHSTNPVDRFTEQHVRSSYCGSDLLQAKLACVIMQTQRHPTSVVSITDLLDFNCKRKCKQMRVCIARFLSNFFTHVSIWRDDINWNVAIWTIVPLCASRCSNNTRVIEFIRLQEWICTRFHGEYLKAFRHNCTMISLGGSTVRCLISFVPMCFCTESWLRATNGLWVFTELLLYYLLVGRMHLQRNPRFSIILQLLSCSRGSLLILSHMPSLKQVYQGLKFQMRS